jgi:hypothetical protein
LTKANIGDVAAPYLIRVINLQATKQIRVNLML